MTYSVTKTFDIGLSAAFRNWRAPNHCRLLHGYALVITVEFEADTLDSTGWVINFGDLGWLRSMLQAYFDHRTLVAEDDPERDWFLEAQERGILSIATVPMVSCEGFAEGIGLRVKRELANRGLAVSVACVTVREHSGNAASWRPMR